MLNPLNPLDATATWVLERYFDTVMTFVVETRSYFAACESVAGDVEHWLWRRQREILR